MFKMSGRAAAIRATVIAGVAAAAVGGFAAKAQAFPALAAAPIQHGAEAVQYYEDGYPYHGHHRYHGRRAYHPFYGHGHRHHSRYGMNHHPAHPGQAGLYDCGPGGKNTRLARKACGGNNRFQHLQQGY